MRIALLLALLAPLPALAGPVFTCTGPQSVVCDLFEKSCRTANAPGIAIEVDPEARRMTYRQNGRAWELLHVETGRGAEVFALTAQGGILVIGRGEGGRYEGTLSSVQAPNASIARFTCTRA